MIFFTYDNFNVLLIFKLQGLQLMSPKMYSLAKAQKTIFYEHNHHVIQMSRSALDSYHLPETQNLFASLSASMTRKVQMTVMKL